MFTVASHDCQSFAVSVLVRALVFNGVALLILGVALQLPVLAAGLVLSVVALHVTLACATTVAGIWLAMRQYEREHRI